MLVLFDYTERSREQKAEGRLEAIKSSSQSMFLEARKLFEIKDQTSEHIIHVLQHFPTISK